MANERLRCRADSSGAAGAATPFSVAGPAVGAGSAVGAGTAACASSSFGDGAGTTGSAPASATAAACRSSPASAGSSILTSACVGGTSGSPPAAALGGATPLSAASAAATTASGTGGRQTPPLRTADAAMAAATTTATCLSQAALSRRVAASLSAFARASESRVTSACKRPIWSLYPLPSATLGDPFLSDALGVPALRAASCVWVEPFLCGGALDGFAGVLLLSERWDSCGAPLVDPSGTPRLRCDGDGGDAGDLGTVNFGGISCWSATGCERWPENARSLADFQLPLQVS